MRVYETMIILDPDLEDSGVRDEVERVKALLEENGGRVRDVDFWGKRELAYEIRHKTEGHYVVITADAEPAAIDEMSRVLKLNDSVFRHKALRLPDSVAQPLS
ncbi:MAG: 30S ribosomal protein S6 [Acidimicrobiia bacterium]|nr:30S ribosomal protein S6 [Acidimicrobiia bacterium]